MEAYIHQHGHLPDVPTTTEVKRNGVEVVETMVTLLRKVEELTLYVIDLKKDNEKLRKAIGE